jgi:hypothetical protein
MPITELLVTGYDGDRAVFAVVLAEDRATVVVTSKDDNGETVVDSAWSQASDALAGMRPFFERITNLTCTST